MQAEAALTQFRAALTHFKPHGALLVPDLALRGLLVELEEHSVAAIATTRGALPHRAVPSARAAYEAAQLAMLLASDPEYPQAGARAWVYYLKKDRELATGRLIAGLDPQAWFEAAVNELGDAWATFRPGARALMQVAVALVESQPRKPDNWAGVNVPRVLGERLAEAARSRGARPTVADAESVSRRAYAALNRSTHPRTFLRPTAIVSEGGRLSRVELERRDEDADRERLDEFLASNLGIGIAACGARVQIAVT